MPGPYVRHADGTNEIIGAAHINELQTGLESLETDRFARSLYQKTTFHAGDTLSNHSVETGYNASYTLPANTLKVGRRIVIRATGHFNTGATTPNLSHWVNLGVHRLLEATFITPASVNVMGWSLEAFADVNNIGATGEVVPGGVYIRNSNTTGGTVTAVYRPEVIRTLDTAATHVISIRVGWSAASASNASRLMTMSIEYV